jgi:hypothetical protein
MFKSKTVNALSLSHRMGDARGEGIFRYFRESHFPATAKYPYHALNKNEISASKE